MDPRSRGVVNPGIGGFAVLEMLVSGIDVSPEQMAAAYSLQVANWLEHEPRPDLVAFFANARHATLRLLTVDEFWSLVWDYWPGHEPHALMTADGANRLLRDVAHVYLREMAGGYERPGFTDRVGALRSLIASGHQPDPVFLGPNVDGVAGGSFWIADGVARMTALATVALEGKFDPRPAAIIAQV